MIYLAIFLILLWIYLLYTLKRAKLKFWRFLLGSVGLFVILMIFCESFLSEFLAKIVTSVAGVYGNITGIFEVFVKYQMVYIPLKTGSMTLAIDFECSGIIEILAFLSLLAFFDAYSNLSKVVIGIAGTLYIILCNALRISLIATAVHFFGIPAYYIFHSIIGRLLFYFLSIILYYFVFTRYQIINTRIGAFNYDSLS